MGSWRGTYKAACLGRLHMRICIYRGGMLYDVDDWSMDLARSCNIELRWLTGLAGLGDLGAWVVH